MAKEIRTRDQRTPQTTETPQRLPPRPVFMPPADIYETRDHIVVLAEMPGVAPDGVDITLERRGCRSSRRHVRDTTAVQCASTPVPRLLPLVVRRGIGGRAAKCGISEFRYRNTIRILR